MTLAIRIASIGCALLALRGNRWAYVTYIVLGLLYFPADVGFHLHPRACEVEIGLQSALFSLTNWAHIVIFTAFYVMTAMQFRRRTRGALAWALVIAVLMGAAVEVAEGVTGNHNCRLRDLVPDAAGALLGVALVVAWWTTSAAFRAAPS